eukprot:354745-Chlamydomonas_euryale.AAC.4
MAVTSQTCNAKVRARVGEHSTLESESELQGVDQIGYACAKRSKQSKISMRRTISRIDSPQGFPAPTCRSSLIGYFPSCGLKRTNIVWEAWGKFGSDLCAKQRHHTVTTVATPSGLCAFLSFPHLAVVELAEAEPSRVVIPHTHPIELNCRWGAALHCTQLGRCTAVSPYNNPRRSTNQLEPPWLQLRSSVGWVQTNPGLGASLGPGRARPSYTRRGRTARPDAFERGNTWSVRTCAFRPSRSAAAHKRPRGPGPPHVARAALPTLQQTSPQLPISASEAALRRRARPVRTPAALGVRTADFQHAVRFVRNPRPSGNGGRARGTASRPRMARR